MPRKSAAAPVAAPESVESDLRHIHFVRYHGGISPLAIMPGARLLREAESREAILRGDCGAIFARDGSYDVCLEARPCPKHKRKDVTEHAPLTAARIVRSLDGAEIAAAVLGASRAAIAAGECGTIYDNAEKICDDIGFPCPKHKPAGVLTLVGVLAHPEHDVIVEAAPESRPDRAANDERPRIALDVLLPSPTNPRRKGLDAPSLAGLVASIQERGVEMSILIRPIPPIAEAPAVTDEIVCGERRFRASKLAGEKDIPYVRRELTDQQVVEIQLLELAQSEGVDPIDQADAMHGLATTYRMDLDAIARKVGLPSADVVRRRLALHDLCQEAREILARLENCEPERALLVATVRDPAAQVRAAEFVTKSRWHGEPPPSIAEARNIVRQNVLLQLARAPWKLDDATLVNTAGPCSTCPKSSASTPALFGDLPAKDALCTDPQCWKRKTDTLYELNVKRAQLKGRKILTDAESKKSVTDHGAAYDGEYIALDDKNYDGARPKTYRQLLKKSDVPVVLGRSPSGAPVELVHKTDLKKALKESGVSVAKSSADLPDRKAQLRKEKIKRETTTRLIGNVVGRIEDGKVTDEVLVGWVAAAVVGRASHDAARAVCKRRGLGKDKKHGTNVDMGDLLEKEAARLKKRDLLALAVECLVTEGSCSSYAPGPSERLTEAAQVFGALDAKEIERVVKAEIAEKDKAKKKPAKTKASQKKHDGDVELPPVDADDAGDDQDDGE